ncbi:phospholipase-like protein [Tanacetum coccineum]
MDNVIEVFDAKVTMRSTLHTLASIKELLCKSGNERRNTIFRSTQFGKWLDFPSFANDNHLLNYIFQHHARILLDNWFSVYEISKGRYFLGLKNSPLIDRVFPEKKRQPLKRVRVIDLLVVTRSAHLWSGLSDEDAVKVCLLLVVNIVFMDREPKNYIVDNLLELVDDLPTWDAYPWGEYIWKAFYRRTIYILEMYTNNKYWWKKDPLVIPRGLSWSKIGNFEKGDYGTLFAEWYNPIMSMAPTSNELLQPWFIRSMEYFGSHDVEHEPLLIDHEIPVGENTVVALERQSEPDFSIERQSEPDVALEPQFEAEVPLEWQSEPDVPMFTREELLAAVKERTTAIETFLKYKNESVSEDLVAKHKEFVHKENESVDGKMAESAISCVLIGEVSGAKSMSNEFVLQQLQSCDRKLPEGSLSNVLNGEFSCDINRPNEHMSEEFVENELESGDGKDNVGFDFDNIENHSLNDMVRTGTEDIHLDELLSENGDQLLSTTDVVEGEKYENGVHVDQSPVEQKCQANVVNENEPPLAVKVVGQLIRKTYKGKALVEPYTVQPPTTASVHLGKAIRNRKKKAAKILQSRKTRILFDDDGDDDHDENTQSNKIRKRKDAIPLSEIAKSEFPLVEYCEVITIRDETTHLLAWGNYDIEVDRSFWLTLLGLNHEGWLSDKHLERESDIPGWVCNGVRYPVIWADMEHVFFSINKPRTHYCLGVLHIRSSVITLYDSMGVSVEDTREWWSDMRIAFKTRMP